MLSNKTYFIAPINSSKAYQFTSFYHYSHMGFKKAVINLGIFRKDSKEMVGVSQWGCSAQNGIRLDRYVKEPITNKEYLELNRFCMSNSEGANAESQAISLSIKWIKQNRPDIRLLVSYAGRKEGNYGFIYQATNWEYLGYFLSSGFWQLDGEERHQITAWFRYKNHGDQMLPFTEGLCDMYHDVRRTTSKQFIYIQRLDKSLTPAVEPLPYPKEATEAPIQTEVKIFKQDDAYLESLNLQETKPRCYFYYEDDQQRKSSISQYLWKFAVYNIDGTMYGTYRSLADIGEQMPGYLPNGVRLSMKEERPYKGKYFRKYQAEEDIPLEIDVDVLCWIDEIAFYNMPDIVKYCGVTKQAVQQSKKKRGKTIGGRPVVWCEENL